MHYCGWYFGYVILKSIAAVAGWQLQAERMHLQKTVGTGMHRKGFVYEHQEIHTSGLTPDPELI